jgi:3-methylcrotonyl-CoA carboxylase beta subunit
MCGRAVNSLIMLSLSPPPRAKIQYSPRFLFMWPNAKICVMGPDQLSSVMQTVSGKNKPAATVQEGEDRWKDLRTKIEAQSEATYSTARIWVSSLDDLSRVSDRSLM